MSEQEPVIFDNTFDALDCYFTLQIVKAIENDEKLPANMIDQILKAARANVLIPKFVSPAAATGRQEGDVVGSISGEDPDGVRDPIPQGQLTLTSKWFSQRWQQQQSTKSNGRSNGAASA